MENVSKKTRKVAMLGMMLAVTVALSAVEHSIPPLPFLPPGVKIGLANVVTMYVLFHIGFKPAVLLAFLKSCFVLLIRGVTAGALSFCGGMLSIGIIMLLMFLFKDKISVLILSVSGAVFHNLGQLVAVSFIMSTKLLFYYAPLLVASGVVMGCLTGILLKVTTPHIYNRMSIKAGE